MSIEQLMTEDGIGFEPAENETADAVFDRMWVRELLLRVWNALQEEFAGSGMEKHCELFRRRRLEPILNGDDPPRVQELADELNMSRKEASDRLVTVRRAFRRLLRQEIRLYVYTEDETAWEEQELCRLAAR